MEETKMSAEKVVKEPKPKLMNIKLEKLHPFESHPYKVLDDESMTELVKSIKEYGLLNRIIVRPLEDKPDEYEIISGHRRVHAAELLEMKEAAQPFAAFCSKCRELGYEIYDMDLITAGEEAYAAMRRSTNGGGENSPMLEGEDDLYELFFAGL